MSEEGHISRGIMVINAVLAFLLAKKKIGVAKNSSKAEVWTGNEALGVRTGCCGFASLDLQTLALYCFFSC